MGRIFLVASLAWLAAACSSGTEPEGGGDATWRANRDKWQAQGITSYDLTLRTECFCGAPSGAVLVVVRNGEVLSRTVVSSGAAVEAAYVKWFPTVLGLFGVVRDALDRRASYLNVQYDETYGYPRSIQVDYSGGAFGDRNNYYVEGFVPIR